MKSDRFPPDRARHRAAVSAKPELRHEPVVAARPTRRRSRSRSRRTARLSTTATRSSPSIPGTRSTRCRERASSSPMADMPRRHVSGQRASATFLPGTAIEVSLGYGDKETSIFSGIVIRQGIEISRRERVHAGGRAGGLSDQDDGRAPHGCLGEGERQRRDGSADLHVRPARQTSPRRRSSTKRLCSSTPPTGTPC